ncbi:geranylgeranyl pyrophosphate synthase [Acrocarpospora pleiomorpha]|uniref:Geranylgeranyl pyrophosphate synthase n=1 Tax=Acrocarpospora pleiomorpha TaxID=90975 RepID=A0A5M3Y395_9ACTN|nr:polyprenyl synthetase family protein [Acrocarpospora pleiomorpha]GES26413.1 geranylgeranyl pyrophosphate synthase [Acrocarpospora pleiomorpha]
MWTISDDVLADWTRRSLAAVDDLLRATLHSPGDPFLTTVATHLLAAGGKRVRPAIVLLAARFGDPGYDRPAVVRAAAAVELMHVASLYHDDVMDEATTRRGVPSVNVRWGNRVAILAGDYLVAKAAELAAPLGTGAVEEQARMLTRLVTGQLRETVGAGPRSDPERYYLSVIADKTAALFALAARLGARASGAPDDVTTALGTYGEALGIAFQLSDDVLDVTRTSGQTGKPAGADLRQGVATLPVLRALRRRKPIRKDLTRTGKDSALLRKMLASGPITDAGELATAARLLSRSPGVAQTRTEAERYANQANQAKQALRSLPASVARDALDGLCDHIVSRLE